MNIDILQGVPTPQDWEDIGYMIAEGYHTGIDRPAGINWTAHYGPGESREDFIEE